MRLSMLVVVGICLMVAAASAAPPDASFDALYAKTLCEQVGGCGWIVAVVAGFAVSALLVVTGGAGALVAPIGTWIGNLAGLSGAAATSYGLAFIGGGSLASGGGGVAAGTAILAAALLVAEKGAQEVLKEQVAEKVKTQVALLYEDGKFEERLATQPKFPLPAGKWSVAFDPRLAENGLKLQRAAADVESAFKSKSNETDASRSERLDRAEKSFNATIRAVIDDTSRIGSGVHHHALLSILHLHLNETTPARQHARQALLMAGTPHWNLKRGDNDPSRDARIPELKADQDRLIDEVVDATVRKPALDGHKFGLALATFAVADLTTKNLDPKSLDRALAAIDSAISQDHDNRASHALIPIAFDLLREQQSPEAVERIGRLYDIVGTRLSNQKNRSGLHATLAIKTLEGSVLQSIRLQRCKGGDATPLLKMHQEMVKNLGRAKSLVGQDKDLKSKFLPGVEHTLLAVLEFREAEQRKAAHEMKCITARAD